MQSGNKSWCFYMGVPDTVWSSGWQSYTARTGLALCLSLVLALGCCLQNLYMLSHVPVATRTLDAADLGFDPGGIFMFESYLLFNVSLFRLIFV